MNSIHNVSQCRILLVDDLPDNLRVLEGLLRAEGYAVQTASNRRDALDLLAAERFHIAVVDVRLDARDTNNRDGLRLMHEIRALDPTIAVIILTVHADINMVREALQPSPNFNSVFNVSRSPAAEFLQKTPDDLVHLPGSVQNVFEQIIGINRTLEILDPHRLLPTIPERLRFVDQPRPDAHHMYEEAEELLRKLFPNCQRIELQALTSTAGGYSRAIVFQVTPWIDGDPGALVIAKIGEHTLIEKEVLCYQRYIHGRIANNRSPVALHPVCRTRSLGGIVYTFVGLGGTIHDFADFYAVCEDEALIAQAVKNLFMDTLSLQHGSTGGVRRSTDMRQLYTSLLRLDTDELEEKLYELLDQAKAIYKANNRKKFWLPNGKPMLNPLDFAFTASMTADYYESTIHGDLHSHNIMVNRHHDTWLIDFANTGKGPLLQDYVTFETSLLIEINGCKNGRLLFEWARLLFTSPDLRVIPLSDTLAADPHLRRAHMTIMAARQLALRERFGEANQNERTYLIGMLFTTLRLMTVRFLSPAQRFHALICASFIASRLDGLG